MLRFPAHSQKESIFAIVKLKKKNEKNRHLISGLKEHIYIHDIHDIHSPLKNLLNSTPSGLEDVSKYPTLFAELIGFGWTVEELTKLAGGNLLRVFKEVEAIRDKMLKEKVPPIEDIFANRIENPHKCQSN